MALKLFYGKGACSRASHIALEETGAPFEPIRLNLRENDQRKPEYLALNPKGDRMVSTGHGARAEVWDLETHKVTTEYSGYRNVGFCVAWHPDGERIAVAGGTGDRFTVKVLNAESLNTQDLQEVYSLPVGSEYFAAAFSNDGNYLITGGARGSIEVWDAKGGQRLRTLEGRTT